MDGACWVCFCCRHSPIYVMNVRIFWVRAMKCMCAQTRPQFILSSEGVFRGMKFEPMLTPREKSPLPENVPREGSNPRRCGQRAQALPTELFQPPININNHYHPYFHIHYHHCCHCHNHHLHHHQLHHHYQHSGQWNAQYFFWHHLTALQTGPTGISHGEITYTW